MKPISLVFPVLAMAVSLLAYNVPGLFAPFSWSIVYLMVVIMFAMGLNLRYVDFVQVAKSPAPVFLGATLQFTVMPLSALAIGHIFNLRDELIVGLVLLGTCPGGTSSNVMAFLAKANIALSVSMTLVSTLLAVVATPLLTWALIGRVVPVDPLAMLQSVARIVLIPVVLGVLVNAFFEDRIQRLKKHLPTVATIAILLAIAIIVGTNSGTLATAGVAIFFAVLAHNAFGMFSGYLVPRVLGYDEKSSRTMAFEVGMQSCALSVVLALQHFTPLAALPGAIACVWQNLSGAFLAGVWGSKSLPGAKTS